MSTASILNDKNGPDWPLGFIAVTSAGTPVGIMSVVDPNAYNAPQTPTGVNSDEYSRRANQIIVQAIKPNTGMGAAWINNTGNIYLIRKGSGTSNATDSGVLVKMLTPGETFVLAASPVVNDVFGPYRYYIDADNNADGANVVLLIF